MMGKFILVVLLMCVTSVVFAGEVQYRWDHDGGVDGYRVFLRYGSDSYDYSSPVWEGPEKISGAITVEDNQMFHAVVRAYLEEFQSADSEEVSHVILSSPNGFTISIPAVR